jgi:hypothetical protein
MAEVRLRDLPSDSGLLVEIPSSRCAVLHTKLTRRRITML